MKRLMIPLAAVLALFGCSRMEEPASVPEGACLRVTAGFGEEADTRSRIRQEGNTVKVLWTAGDSFEALYSVGGSYYKASFRTEDDGVSEASFTSNPIQSGAEAFHCLYPGVTRWSLYNGDRIFGINLPSEQTAVAGGIEEGLNRAYAYADQLTQDLDGSLKFYNIPALLKFRLSGAVVPEVKEIVFSGSGVLAGDLVFRRSGEVLEEVSGISYSGTSTSSKVTLKGDFEEEKDYYIAVWPRTLSWFRMEFRDEDGNSTLKQSSKSLTFERSRTRDFGTIDLGDAFDEINDGSMDPVQYRKATEGTKPVTIAVIPEGFTKEEMGQYELLAKSGLNALFGTEPYKTYADRFNVYILKVASRESGASISDGNGNITTPVSTYFGAYWGENTYNDMRADDNTVFEFVSGHCPDIVDGTHTMAEVPVLMIINDARYGGKCWSFSDGKAYGMVPYTYGGESMHWSFPSIVPTTDDPLPTPVTSEILQKYYRSTTQEEYAEVGSSSGDWRNTVVHEFGGHAFGRLGDEYWSNTSFVYNPNSVTGHDWPVPFSLNVASDPADALWQELLDQQESLVAGDPHYGRIGLFQGGGTCIFGRWRSEMISCMIDNRCYFSAWQRYLITKRIFELSGDGDSFSFATWLAGDVTADPVRDIDGSGVLGLRRSGPVHEVGPLPPPGLVE